LGFGVGIGRKGVISGGVFQLFVLKMYKEYSRASSMVFKLGLKACTNDLISLLSPLIKASIKFCSKNLLPSNKIFERNFSNWIQYSSIVPVLA
jgi:hypothetical protein